MPCRRIPMPGGGAAIVCGPRRRVKRCACGNPHTALCDWKVKTKKSGTCDKALCAECTTVPAPGKDLCPKHAAEWEARKPATLKLAPLPERKLNISRGFDAALARAPRSGWNRRR
jgi:hypothetical protein